MEADPVPNKGELPDHSGQLYITGFGSGICVMLLTAGTDKKQEDHTICDEAISVVPLVYYKNKATNTTTKKKI